MGYVVQHAIDSDENEENEDSDDNNNSNSSSKKREQKQEYKENEEKSQNSNFNSEAIRKPIKKTSFYSGTYPTQVPTSLLRAPSNFYHKDNKKPVIKKEHPHEYTNTYESYQNPVAKFSAISQPDRSCFAPKPSLKQAIHRNAGQAYIPPPPPLEDDKELKIKQMEAQKVDNEKEKYRFLFNRLTLYR
jgi:hypothetical protein